MSNIKDLPINLMYSFAINFTPLWGGLFGLYTAGHWGGLKSSVGKGVFYLSLGLLSWSAGSWIWSGYNFFLGSNVPYPSLADLGYLGAVPLWMAGAFYLSEATGVKYGLRKKIEKLYLFILPVVTIAVSYYLLVAVAREGSFVLGGGPLKIFFDIAYPIGDVVIITIALLVYGLSLRYLGGRYKWPVLITLFGFVVMFCADFTFSYTTTINTYFNGSLADLLFTTALSIIGVGVASFDTKT